MRPPFRQKLLRINGGSSLQYLKGFVPCTNHCENLPDQIPSHLSPECASNAVLKGWKPQNRILISDNSTTPFKRLSKILTFPRYFSKIHSKILSEILSHHLRQNTNCPQSATTNSLYCTWKGLFLPSEGAAAYT